MWVELKPWTVEDAQFICEVRNDPALMKWFRQNGPLYIEEQKRFIGQRQRDKKYIGYIVVVDDRRVGFVALIPSQEDGAEFSIGIASHEQKKGYAGKAMVLLEDMARQYGFTNLHSWVFAKNPALSFYLHKCGFTIIDVQRHYWKKSDGCVDAVFIEKRL